jgi:hypothetical protein
VKLPEAGDDQIEPDLKGAHLAVGPFTEVLLAVLVEIWVPLRRDRLRELRDEARDLLGRAIVAGFPEREAEDVSVEDVIGVVGRLGGEAGLP